MSTTYEIYEDQNIRIDTTEQSCEYDMSIAFKSQGQYPHTIIELFNNKSLSAKELVDMGYKILYAAFLQLDEPDKRNIKELIGNL